MLGYLNTFIKASRGVPHDYTWLIMANFDKMLALPFSC
jgi:hypothetical protein